MSFDFDKRLPLRGAHTSKYDGIAKNYGIDDPDAIAMWVADMDFEAAPAIKAALQAEVDRGYFGYFSNPEPMNNAVANWMETRHGWAVNPKWVRYTHGVIGGLGDLIDAYSDPGDGVILFTPVYHAFARQTKAQGRVVVESPLRVDDGRFEMELDGLESSLQGHERIVIFCSPHNPGGRIWSVEEIRALADFCARHDLLLISDEIHMDLTYPGVRYTPTCVAAPEHMGRIAVVTAASKSFNIAGMETGLAIYPNDDMRRKLDKVMLDRESSPNRFAMAMIKAAFDESVDWIDALQEYIAENFRIFKKRIEAIPGVTVMDMQATYLSWVDFTPLGMDDKEVLRRCVNDAKVIPSPGTVFGTGGEGHMRFNLAMPRPLMLEALDRLDEAFADVQ